MTAWKLFRVRRDGSLGSLFVDRRRVLPIGVWLDARDCRPKGLAYRPGWHASESPALPHLSRRGRVLCLVALAGEIVRHERPASQGGAWLTATRLMILEKRSDSEDSACNNPLRISD